MTPPIDQAAMTLIAALIASLRVAPALAFAPPFTLIRAPLIARVALGVGLGLWLATSHANQIAPDVVSGSRLPATILSELLLGLSLTLSLQLAFAALATAGRVIDFQTGFGFALLADPSLRSQMPLVGALFAYAAGAVFFSTSGPADMLAIWSRSLDAHPLGDPLVITTLAPLLSYTALCFAIAFGIGAVVMAGLFVADLAIALMSRTLPQMNVLMLGFQVKTAALLVLLPFVFSLSGAGFLRLVRFAIDNAGRLI